MYAYTLPAPGNVYPDTLPPYGNVHFTPYRLAVTSGSEHPLTLPAPGTTLPAPGNKVLKEVNQNPRAREYCMSSYLSIYDCMNSYPFVTICMLASFALDDAPSGTPISPWGPLPGNSSGPGYRMGGL